MWLTTWSLQEFFRRSGKVTCDGDHNYFWEPEMEIGLPTFSSRLLEHIPQAGRSNFKPQVRRGGWAGLIIIYYRMQAYQHDLAYQLSQPFPVAQRVRADGNFHVAHPMSWQLGHKEQKGMRPHESQQKTSTKICDFSAPVTGKSVLHSTTFEMSTHKRIVDRHIVELKSS